MLFAVLLALNIAVCICLVGVVLLQRSEGGALGMGGGPSGFMTARGAGNLLTQVTWGLGIAFFVLSLTLTLLSGRAHSGDSVVDRIKVDAINPRELNRPAAPAPAAPPSEPVQPARPGPLQAPTPTLRYPFAPAPAGDAPAQP
ncbi:preprotein translocase subunit SecG [Phenylobacterium sp.]|jgi:preprotein translocase subunit SecG|uniref:preprotein translocase subunit SecG n=1 Tax=Phenylobacterium sp. TaxID=1871053 RepID=UPI002F3FC1C6